MDRRARLLLLTLFLLSLPALNPTLRGDGVGYYAYVRSAVIDGDLSFDNEFERGGEGWQRLLSSAPSQLRTRDGRLMNLWAVGPALAWTPFFVSGHALALGLGRLMPSLHADGYSWPYVWLSAFGTALYSFLGLLLAFTVARRFFGPRAALMATLAIWFASSLPVYMYFLPFQAHALAGAGVSLFLWWWLRTEAARGWKQWLVWGALGGLMVEIYYVNATFLLIPLAEWVRAWPRRAEATTRRAWFGHGLSFALAGILAMLPHFATRFVFFGSPFTTGYDYVHGREVLRWLEPRLWQVGFSAEHGMFLWTPVLLLALVGLLLFAARERWRGGLLLAACAAFYYVVASYWTWHGLSSFGSRYFVSCTPVFVLGLAAFLDASRRALERLRERIRLVPRPGLILVPLLVALVLWNIGFIFQWGTNVVPNRGPVDFGVVARNQVTIVPRRIGGFLARYLSDREGVVREITDEDIREFDDYQFRR